MHPFAVLNGANQTPAWSDELAAHHIMCLGNCSLAVPREASSRSTRRTSSATGPTPEQAGLLTAKLVTNLLDGQEGASTPATR